MQVGAIEFLTKPVHGKSLMAVIARAYASFYDVDWDFVGEGLSSREIGARLGISTKTVEAHRARINDKMRSDDLPHLIRTMLVPDEEE